MCIDWIGKLWKWDQNVKILPSILESTASFFPALLSLILFTAASEICFNGLATKFQKIMFPRIEGDDFVGMFWLHYSSKIKESSPTQDKVRQQCLQQRSWAQ